MLASPSIVDLNADLGEDCGDDLAMLDVVTSANVACGGHAGDDATMRATCAAALARGVVIGAHPSYADRDNFGRVRLDVDAAALRDQVTRQLVALRRAAADVGAEVAYIKPHGALYNATVTDAAHAGAVVAAVAEVLPGSPVLGLPGSVLLRLAGAAELPTVAEAFADRAYASDGSLVSRSEPGAVLTDAEAVAARVVTMVRDHVVVSLDGHSVPLTPRSVCVHGDTPGAVALARRVRQSLEAAGVTLRPFA